MQTVQSITRDLAATAFMVQREGSTIRDDHHLLVQTFKSGEAQFLVGRSIYCMVPVKPVFITNNICFLKCNQLWLRCYARQIPVDSLFNLPSEDADSPTQIDLQHLLNSRPMDYPGR